MATRFAPVDLLREYILTTGSTFVHHPEGINSPATGMDSHNLRDHRNNEGASLHPATLKMSEAFSTSCHQAQEALMLGQHFQR